jgi:L-amino acid N-acyltransferase YncA
MIEIKPLLSRYAAAVLSIYGEGLQSGSATFNTVIPTWEEWDASHLPHTRLVAIENDTILGWIALLPVSSRACYKGVAEFSIYVALANRGKGTGRLLMEAMIKESEANSIWTLQSSTFEKNISSIELQKKFGFRVIGYRERIAQLSNTWHNTVMLERRSKITGC